MNDRTAFLDGILTRATEALARGDFEMASRWFEVALEFEGIEVPAHA